MCLECQDTNIFNKHKEVSLIFPQPFICHKQITEAMKVDFILYVILMPRYEVKIVFLVTFSDCLDSLFVCFLRTELLSRAQMLRTYFWPCSQGSFLMVLEGRLLLMGFWGSMLG